MAWASLSTTLGNKPHVLAGPLLRRVTTEEATVWLALRKPGTVDLTIYDGNAAILQGRRHTVAIGRNLHIVAVTADKALPPFTGTMAEGKIYQYDLTFAYDDHLSETLASATGGASLAYAPYTRPSFCLPPSNLNALRILHGSCRIPHGNGPDTLPIIDDLILQMAANPDMRPHQLLMTGDQIYADDVGYAMSMMVNDAAEALLGWSEVVPINLPPFGPTKVADLSPALREHALAETAGFTSEDLVGHLVGLGEYLAMYLFVWSDVPWPATGTALPAFAEVANYFASREPGIFSELGYRQVRYEDAKAIDAQTARTQDFRSKLGAVRRALANIPSYMIFDDHEVTDDWNMTRRICTGIYGSDLGLRVVQNALTAYAVCQHWGNVPDDFGMSRMDFAESGTCTVTPDTFRFTLRKDKLRQTRRREGCRALPPDRCRTGTSWSWSAARAWRPLRGSGHHGGWGRCRAGCRSSRACRRRRCRTSAAAERRTRGRQRIPTATPGRNVRRGARAPASARRTVDRG